METLHTSEPAENIARYSFFFRRIFLTISRRRWLFAALVCCSILSLLVCLSYTTDIYVAEAKIIALKGRDTVSLLPSIPGLDILKDIIGASVPAAFESPSSGKIRAVLTSRHFNILLIEKYNLLPILFSNYWNKKTNSWIVAGDHQTNCSPKTYPLFGARKRFIECPPSPLDGVNLLLEKLSVSRVSRSVDWISLTFEDQDPQFAVMMMTRYLAELDDFLRSEAITRATDNQRYIESLMMVQTDAALKERLNILILAQAEQAMYASGKAAFLFEVVDPPILPETPYKPNRVAIILFGLFISFVIPVGIVVLIESLYCVPTQDNAIRGE